MERIIEAILVAVVTFCSASCGNTRYGDISVEGYKLRSFSRVDDRTFQVAAMLSLNNHGPKFSAEQIVGKVNYQKTALGTFFFEPVTVPKGSCDVEFQGKISIDPSVSLVKLIVISRSFNVNDFTFDISAVCKSGMGKVKINKQEIPLSSLVKK